MTTNDVMRICSLYTTWRWRYIAIPCCKRAFRHSQVAKCWLTIWGSLAGAGKNRYTGYASLHMYLSEWTGPLLGSFPRKWHAFLQVTQSSDTIDALDAIELNRGNMDDLNVLQLREWSKSLGNIHSLHP